MDKGYYLRHAEKATELVNDATQSKVSWLQHILLLCSALLGLLAGLQTTIANSLCSRVALVLTIMLLAIGTVLAGISLYGYQILLAQRRRQGYIDEVQQALREDREVEPVFGELPKKYELCEKACYVCLLLSMVLLVSYTIIISFF